MSKRYSSASSSSSKRTRRNSAENGNGDTDNDETPSSSNHPAPFVQFSQQIPDVPSHETSTQLTAVRPTEQNNFANLSSTTQDQMTSLLSRHILFQSLSQTAPLDRLKLTKEAWKDQQSFTSERVNNAALAEACKRMKDVFGMEVRKIPQYMEEMKSLPKKYKERLYVINGVKDNERGLHSKALHSVHVEEAVEKGLLMLTLAFVYCKGEVKEGMRWLGDRDLYMFLNSVDDNIPSEPVSEDRQASRGGGDDRRRSTAASSTPRRRRHADDEEENEDDGLEWVPDVDVSLEKFVHLDYLIKKKADKNNNAQTQSDYADGFYYAIGPRAAMEIGRKQIIYFCAEILDEQPDPTMLSEIEQDSHGEEAVMA